jgi:hypothetical protein
MIKKVRKGKLKVVYYENVVIGEPLVEPSSIFSLDQDDWEKMEKDKTYYTNETFLPKILVELGVAPSVSEVRRNKKEFVKNLEPYDYLEIKWGKRRLFILVGKVEKVEN